MKLIIPTLIACIGLPLAARGEDKTPTPAGGNTSDIPFIQADTWWNLYFSSDKNPLQRGPLSINAVKVIEVSHTNPSWIKITFPKHKEEHLSILRTLADAEGRASDHLSIDAALSDWEETVTMWNTMWVNLDHVVYITKVDPNP